ncbi:MAG TPA: hypothetical protein V6C76_08000 [Drouetiella sp.]
MATAYVHQIMPSMAVSFKLGSPMKLYGSITSDRPWSVGGQIGRTAHTIPATYEVVDETRHLSHTYHCNIIDHPDLTPELIAATAMSAIDTTHQSSAPYILKVTSTIETTDGATVQRLDRFSSHFSAHSNSLSALSRLRNNADPVAGYLYYAATQIMDNEFKHQSIRQIHLKIALEDGHNAARIERIYAENPVVEPGETVKVDCVIKPYNKERTVKTIEVTVPRDVPDGNIVLAVASGDEIETVRRRVGLVDPPTENMEHVLNKLRNRARGDALCAVLVLPEQSVTVNGMQLLNPPAHWNKLFLSDRYTRGAVLSKGEIRRSQIQEYLLDGAHVMTVEVRRKDKSATRSQPMSVPGTNVSNSLDYIAITDLARKTIGRVDTSAITTTSSSSSTGGSGVTATVIQPQTSSQSAEKAPPAPPPTTPFWSSTNKKSPHMRSLQVWSQESEAEFRNGKTDSTTIDSWGRITAGFQSLGKSTIKHDMRIWSATCVNKQFYFATTRKIFRWNSESKSPELVAELNGVAIPALVSDSHGILYAASVPSARIYAIDPTKPVGQNTTLATSLNEPLISAMTIDKADNLYIGVTGSGKVYKQKAGIKTALTTVFDSGQADVTALFFNPTENKLYVGTAEKGAVYSIDEAGKAHAEYQTPDHIVTGVAKDKGGNLYVATAGTGHLVKISADGEVDTLATSDAFYTLYYNQSNDRVYSGDGEGDITEARYDPLSRQSYFVPVSHTEQDAVLALCSDNNGKLFAGTCNMPIAQVFEMKPAEHASYTSEIRDGLRSSKWSRLRAFGGYNEVNDTIKRAIKVETRTGQTSQPDVSWSDWADAAPGVESYEIKSPAARYLQYRLTWKSEETAKGHPVAVGKVDVTFLPANSSPQIAQVSLKSGTAVHGKEEITVNGTDSDGDNLMLAMQLSSDGGKTWQTVVNDLRSIKPIKETAVAETPETTETIETTETKRPTPLSTTPQVVPKADEALPPQVPPPGGTPSQWQPQSVAGEAQWTPVDEPSRSDKDASPDKDASADADKSGDTTSITKIERVETSTSKPAVVTAKKKNKSKTKPGPTAEGNTVTTSSDSNGEKFTIKWDTSKFKEGNYIVRFTLDDKLSNADNSSQASVLRTIDVDNTPPQIVSAKWTRGKSGAAKLRVEAKDQFTPIVNATYKLDDGEPLALTGINDPGDGLTVLLGADEITFAKQPHKVEIVVLDRAGNSVTKTIDVD